MSRVHIPPSLACYAGDQQTLELEGGTVRAVMDSLAREYPELGRHLLREDGLLRSYVNVYVNEEDIRALRQLDTSLGEGDTVTVVPSIAGG